MDLVICILGLGAIVALMKYLEWKDRQDGD